MDDEDKKMLKTYFTGGIKTENMKIYVTVNTFGGLFWIDLKKTVCFIVRLLYQLLECVLPSELKRNK